MSSPSRGYPSLAQFLSKSPECAVFRKFSHLNVRNLLYLQMEAQFLEEELQNYELDTECDSRKHANRSYRQLLRGSTEEDRNRIAIIRRLRVVLKDYNEALLLYSQVLTQQVPNRRVMRCLNSWMEEEKRFLIDGGDLYLRDESDLAALTGQLTQTDSLTEGVRQIFGHKVQNNATYLEGGSQIVFFPHDRIDIIVGFIRVALAAGFLIGAIAALYYARRAPFSLQLAIYTALVILFGLCLTFTTTATKGEIYSASAAYAAVLVVFVSGQISNQY